MIFSMNSMAVASLAAALMLSQSAHADDGIRGDSRVNNAAANADQYPTARAAADQDEDAIMNVAYRRGNRYYRGPSNYRGRSYYRGGSSYYRNPYRTYRYPNYQYRYYGTPRYRYQPYGYGNGGVRVGPWSFGW